MLCVFRPPLFVPQDRLNESPLERTERLAYVDAQRREHIKKQLQHRHYSQYLHRPTIDTISAKLARSKTDHELSENPQADPTYTYTCT